MKLKLFHRASLLTALLFILLAGKSLAELSPEAKEAEREGIIAAKNQEWEIAIQKFQKARETAPNAPELLKNIGKAESYIPQHELRAVAWFGAYLAASTNAPDKTVVNGLIIRLQIKSQGNLSNLIKMVQDAANQTTGDNRDANYGSVAELWARFGDMKAAIKVMGQIKDLDKKRDVQNSVAQAQASDGSTTENHSQVQPVIPVIIVSDWIKILYDDDQTHDCALYTEQFLDLAGFLTAQHSDDPQILFNDLKDTALKIAMAYNTIDEMLKHPEIFAQTKADSYLFSGNAKEPKGDRVGAIADYNIAIELKPDYFDAFYKRGIAKCDKAFDDRDDGAPADFYGDIDGAIADFSRAIGLRPDYPDSYYNRGMAKAKRADHYDLASSSYDDAQANSDWDGAIADFSQAIELKPDYADAYFNRGMAKEDRGDLTGAKADYTKTMELKPDFDQIQICIDNVNSQINKKILPQETLAEAKAKTILEPTMEERVEIAEKQMIELVPKFQPLRYYETLGYRLSAIEERLVLQGALQPSEDRPLLSMEQRLEQIETSIVTLSQQAKQPNINNGQEQGTKTGVENETAPATKEYNYQGRQVNLAPEMVFDLTGNIESARVVIQSNSPIIEVVLKNNAKQALNDFLKQNIGKEVGMLYKGKLVSVAVVLTLISDGRLQISGGGSSLDEQIQLATELSGT